MRQPMDRMRKPEGDRRGRPRKDDPAPPAEVVDSRGLPAIRCPCCGRMAHMRVIRTRENGVRDCVCPSCGNGVDVAFSPLGVVARPKR